MRISGGGGGLAIPPAAGWLARAAWVAAARVSSALRSMHSRGSALTVNRPAASAGCTRRDTKPAGAVAVRRCRPWYGDLLSSARWLGTNSRRKTAQAFCPRQNTPRRSHPRRASSSSKVDLRFAISALDARRSPSRPSFRKRAGNCQVLPEKISGRCNPLQAKHVWAGYE